MVDFVGADGGATVGVDSSVTAGNPVVGDLLSGTDGDSVGNVVVGDVMGAGVATGDGVDGPIGERRAGVVSEDAGIMAIVGIVVDAFVRNENI
jgi:hypothetical protein